MPLAQRYIDSDGFRRAFDRLGDDFQTGRKVHLLAPLMETEIAAHGGDKAPDAGRICSSLHIQGPVQWALSLMTITGKHYRPVRSISVSTTLSTYLERVS